MPLLPYVRRALPGQQRHSSSFQPSPSAEAVAAEGGPPGRSLPARGRYRLGLLWRGEYLWSRLWGGGTVP
ncbi:hypothetical protein V8C26DRAFT_397775 [Trichoderma gracile]